ncbi:MAG: glycosyltransferase family 4 protein [Sphingomonas sp.]|uniref:glycosyltransferase family 4 protein n=1 Tax=Sphingomonas sp. TaxID=28214 RepID=UPI001AD3EF01|nr:glycosyltransferase family 4 protein [Sphingomonas sp.]MBN8806916.1 glycosyltransferase family 4 protein [Sphingomonas sp.]
MHILFLTHYFPPEVNAPASRTWENVRLWKAMGHRVTVVTCAPNHPNGIVYPGYRNRWFQRETIEGIDIIRVGILLSANKGMIRRTLSFISYMIAVILNAWRIPSADIVVSTSPQFFCGLAGAFFQRRRPWVLEIRDLWPESVVAVGAAKHSPITRFFEAIEHWAYHRADRIVALSPAFVGHIQRWRPKGATVDVIENGVDLAFYDVEAAKHAGRRLRAELGLGERFIAAYIGTHGMAHGLTALLDAAELLRGRLDIVILMVGDGAERDSLAKAVAQRDLGNVIMTGQRPKSDMPGMWQISDASLVLLRRSEAFEAVLPSKMFEAMALCRPIVLGVEGEAKSLLARSGAGVAVAPEDAEAIAEAIRMLADDPAGARRMGEKGRLFVEIHHDRRRLAEKYVAILEQAVADHRAGR